MKFKKSVLLALIVVLISAFTVKTADGYQVGDTIDDFQLKNIDDKMVSLSDYSNAKGIVIIFTCNTCPYSVANEDRIIALDKKYKKLGYPVIAINPNNPKASKGDSLEKMKIRAEEKGFTFPYLLDEGQEVYPKFGATKTPHVFIISNPSMRVEYIGAIDNNSRDADAVTEKYVEDVLDALLEKKVPSKTNTRAIGCSIKVL